MSRDVMQQMYQRLLTEPHAPKVCDELEAMLREELAKPDHIPDAGKMVEPERRSLTDEFLEALAEKHVTNCYFDTMAYARTIEALHGIKEQP